MDSFEWNKIVGAVLLALLLSVGLSIFSDVIFETEAPEAPGYVIAIATPEGGAPAEAIPIATLLATADPKAGEGAAKKCVACHTFASGEPNKVGPNLWNIVNRPIASHEGYEYDDAMHAFAGQAKTWTFDNLNAFLHDPKATVPGTKMAFPGLKNNSERANVIAYLRTLSESPAPLPVAAEAPAETDVASAEGQATATDAAPAGEAAAKAPAETAPSEAPPADQPAAAAPAAKAPAKAPATSTADAAPNAETPATTIPPAQTKSAAPAEQPAAEEQTAQAEAPATAAAPAASGDPAKGETFAGRCKACHTFEKGGPNRVGPHLFGVVGRAIASVPEFNYSDAMKAFGAGGKVWDEATLDMYLADPKGSIPGNKMAFPGVKKDTDRANIVAYLKTLAE